MTAPGAIALTAAAGPERVKVGGLPARETGVRQREIEAN